MAVSTRTDEEIQRDVLEELKWDTTVRPNEVGVSVKDGIVTLTGWVDSYLKKIHAEEAAHRVRGVKAVVNDIEVRLPSAAERTDQDLAAAALRALEWDAAIPSGAVTLTVSKGWVTLKGEVEYAFQKRDAERAVQRLTGVRGVTNLIVVKQGRLARDGAILRRETGGGGRHLVRSRRYRGREPYRGLAHPVMLAAWLASRSLDPVEDMSASQ